MCTIEAVKEDVWRPCGEPRPIFRVRGYKNGETRVFEIEANPSAPRLLESFYWMACVRFYTDWTLGKSGARNEKRGVELWVKVPSGPVPVPPNARLIDVGRTPRVMMHVVEQSASDAQPSAGGQQRQSHQDVLPPTTSSSS